MTGTPKFYGALFSLILAIGACGGAAPAQTEDQFRPDETDDAPNSKADGASSLRLGNYALEPSLNIYGALNLHSNNKMDLRGGCRPAAEGQANCFALAELPGTYKLTKSGSKRFIRLYSSIDGKLAFRLQYKVSGDRFDKVVFTDTVSGEEIDATLAEADRSQEGEFCGGFAPTVNQCASNLRCQASVACCDMPGRCVAK